LDFFPPVPLVVLSPYWDLTHALVRETDEPSRHTNPQQYPPSTGPYPLDFISAV